MLSNIPISPINRIILSYFEFVPPNSGLFHIWFCYLILHILVSLFNAQKYQLLVCRSRITKPYQKTIITIEKREGLTGSSSHSLIYHSIMFDELSKCLSFNIFSSIHILATLIWRLQPSWSLLITIITKVADKYVIINHEGWLNWSIVLKSVTWHTFITKKVSNNYCDLSILLCHFRCFILCWMIANILKEKKSLNHGLDLKKLIDVDSSVFICHLSSQSLQCWL